MLFRYALRYNRHMPKPKNYHAIHTWLFRQIKSKKRKCGFCGSKNKLQFALRRGRKHRKDLDSYLVLCIDCHFSYDCNKSCVVCGTRCRNGMCCSCRQRAIKMKSPVPITIRCFYCNKKFTTKHKKRKFCGINCRVNAFYKRHKMRPYDYLKKYVVKNS